MAGYHTPAGHDRLAAKVARTKVTSTRTAVCPRLAPSVTLLLLPSMVADVANPKQQRCNGLEPAM